jgi:hypothetical protein
MVPIFSSNLLLIRTITRIEYLLECVALSKILSISATPPYLFIRVPFALNGKSLLFYNTPRAINV